jgi:hypothetical protein
MPTSKVPPKFEAVGWSLLAIAPVGLVASNWKDRR